MTTKTTPRHESVEAYIATFPEAVAERLRVIRDVILEEDPGAGEAISYNIPAFSIRGARVYIAGWKKHISLYPISGEMERAIPEIAAYTTSGKGTIQFPHTGPLPPELIRAIVRYLMREANG